MKITHDFDFVLDTQQVFRVLLDCLANPGRVRELAPSSEKLGMDQCHLLALGITLLDNEVTFFTGGDEGLAGQLAALTLSNQAPADQADYLFIPDTQWERLEEFFQAAKPGDLVNPHKSATLVLEAPELLGGVERVLSGPGVDGQLPLSISGWVDRAIQARDSRELRFPLGLDLLLVDPAGRLLCLPRTTRVSSPNSTER